MKACPVCALDVEDSYLFCPEDGASLTESADAAPKVVVAQTTAETMAGHKSRLTSLNLTRPQIDRPQVATLEPEASSIDRISKPSNVAHREIEDTESNEPEQHHFRIAAIATIAALALFALIGLYAVLSGLSRRPSPTPRLADDNQPAQPFVVTPQEAQDYKEEPAVLANDLSHAPPLAHDTGRVTKESPQPSLEQRDRKSETPKPVSTRRESPAPAPIPAHVVSTAPAPETTRPNSGDFDSRLVRARASKTASGYRYDLTFNMQEQRGHSAQWQRVLITTRSASGINHSQALPFVHRLGGTGALTFTISIELTGRSEADWRGRINCTTLGWNNAGAPLQTSFVANVTP